MNYTTKYFDIYQVPNLEPDTIIENAKASFAKFGIPQIVVFDTELNLNLINSKCSQNNVIFNI